LARATENKLILVVRKTRLADLVARFNNVEQARFYVEHAGQDFSDYLAEDEVYQASVRESVSVLEQVGRVQILDRTFLPNFLFGPDDVVIALGQDGLVANTLKYLGGQPLVGVNPDSRRWDGVLLPFAVADLRLIVPETLEGKRPVKMVTMAEARLNNGQRLRAVNDLFVGPKSHTSARYRIRSGETEERHSSSGLIVSTGLGSTGWLKSLVAGATGISAALGLGQRASAEQSSFPWDADHLVFTVREPFPSRTTQTGLVSGQVSVQQPLLLTSLMPENGVIFSDGIEADFLEFNSGSEATISICGEKGRLVR